MANIKGVKKRVLLAEQRTVANKSKMNKLRTLIRKFEDAIKNADKDEAQKAFIATQSAIDKTAKTNIIHKANASRKLSKLHSKLKTLVG